MRFNKRLKRSGVATLILPPARSFPMILITTERENQREP